MPRQFIPFPIFPPYAYWRPNCEDRFPANVHVDARMAEVEPACFPFISVWYADRFINWIAHNWSPQKAHLQYSSCIHGLEKMINWSFANNRCLLDWTRDDFENYADFIRNPPDNWAIAGNQPRFIVSPRMDYRDWPINPHWSLFQGTRASDFGTDIDKNVWKREIRCVTQFLDFYLKYVGVTRPNVASAKLESLVFRVSESREVVSDVEMAWILETLASLLDVHKYRVVEMYLIVARYSNMPLWSVVGTASSPGSVDQFTRGADGRWLEYDLKQRALVPLSPVFDGVFDRYLMYLNIDFGQPLPASSMFPREASHGAYDRKGLWRILNSVRQPLADAAKASSNPAISQSAEKIRGLTSVLVKGHPPAGD